MNEDALSLAACAATNVASGSSDLAGAGTARSGTRGTPLLLEASVLHLCSKHRRGSLNPVYASTFIARLRTEEKVHAACKRKLYAQAGAGLGGGMQLVVKEGRRTVSHPAYTVDGSAHLDTVGRKLRRGGELRLCPARQGGRHRRRSGCPSAA